MNLLGLGYNILSGLGDYASRAFQSLNSTLQSFGSLGSTKLSGSAISALHDDLDKPREKCGVFAYFSKTPDLKLGEKLYQGLIGIQHRGQHGSGLTYTPTQTNELITIKGAIKVDTQGRVVDKDSGLVNEVLDKNQINTIIGNTGIAHTLYSTAGAGSTVQAQPIQIGEGAFKISLAHNGNLSDLKPLQDFLREKGIATQDKSDSAMMTDLIHWHLTNGSKSLEEAIKKSAELFRGSYSLVVMHQGKIAVLRDPSANRPLSIAAIGKDNKAAGIVVCSETAPFGSLGAEFIRDVRAGELLILDQQTTIDDIKYKEPNIIFNQTKKELCPLEYIYFMKPSSKVGGKSISEIRRNLGKEVAKEFRQEHQSTQIDLVVPIPESGIPAATGFAQELGLPINPAIIKNFHRRTFIDNGNNVENKFSVIDDAIADRRIALVDDSIIRGKSSKAVLDFVKKANPKEIHLISASPPVLYENRYGVNLPQRKDLIASQNQSDFQKIAQELGADSVSYLSLNGFKKALGEAQGFEQSIFTGEYGIEKLANKTNLRPNALATN